MKIKIRNSVHDCAMTSDDDGADFFDEFARNGLYIEHLKVVLDPADGLARVTMRGYLVDSEIDVPEELCGIAVTKRFTRGMEEPSELPDDFKPGGTDPEE